MKTRVTTEIIKSGQPRPYADTEYVCRVTFERTTWSTTDTEFMPHRMNEKAAMLWLKYVQGFTPFRKGEVEWFDTYLDYVRPVDGGSDDVASVWEFRTVTAYTD